MHPRAREFESESVHIAGSPYGAPVVTYMVANQVWRLEHDYLTVDGPTTITIPGGYEFDLASVPRPLWSVIAPFELSISAPLVHDFIYEFRGVLPAGATAPERTYTRKEADRLFAEMMSAEGVPAWRRVLANVSVRLFARFPSV